MHACTHAHMGGHGLQLFCFVFVELPGPVYVNSRAINYYLFRFYAFI